jgi:hypothetical protein
VSCNLGVHGMCSCVTGHPGPIFLMCCVSSCRLVILQPCSPRDGSGASLHTSKTTSCCQKLPCLSLSATCITLRLSPTCVPTLRCEAAGVMAVLPIAASSSSHQAWHVEGHLASSCLLSLAWTKTICCPGALILSSLWFLQGDVGVGGEAVGGVFHY